ncbi:MULTISPECIES: transposase [unclassified Rhizobium]|uniref:transposase n=1 Tax=Rhizobium sp. Leaf453 TaxID=1736380 RepID=UPI0009EB8A34
MNLNTLGFFDAFFPNFGARIASRAIKFQRRFSAWPVRQITERGYPIANVSQRLGVSQHSLSEWKNKFAMPGTKDSNGAAYFAGDAK